MTNDYLRCSKDFEYCRDWYLEKNKGTWNQTIVKESTPSWVVKDMVDLLPEDSFTLDAKFIDIFSKSGIFLEVIRNKLMRNQAHIDKFPDPKERFNYITRNQLYALVWCDGVEDVVENQLALTTVAIYGRLVDNPNVYRVEIDRKTLKKEEGVHKFIELFYSEEYFKGMKFNTVIGNPPYNNDIYLDFVKVGHELSTKNSVWITPAKWQAKGGQKNEDFRKEIVPYMSKIVYYPDCGDVFVNTGMHGDAISYYFIDKNIHNDKTINGITIKDWDVDTSLNISVIGILSKVREINGKTVFDTDGFKPCKSYFTSMGSGDETVDSTSNYFMRNARRDVPVSKDRFTHIEDMDKYKVYTPSLLTNRPTCYICEPNVAFVRQSLLLGFGSKEKCESIKSYYMTNLIWYIVRAREVATSLVEAFRFVPDPQDWSIIYEDRALPGYTPDKDGIYKDNNGNKHCSLYTKYDLSDDEIKIIESVIKERK